MRPAKVMMGVIVLTTFLTACQSTTAPRQLVSETNMTPQQSQHTLKVYEASNANYESWLAKMEQSQSLRLYSNERVDDLFDAWSDAVDVYEDFANNPAKAMESYSVFSSGTYAETFDKRLAEVSVLHEGLLRLKSNADTLLAQAMAEMAYLDSIDAKRHFDTRYRRLSADYRELFEYVADNDIDDTQLAQAEFLVDAKALEVAVALKANLDPIKQEIALLKQEGFGHAAPISFTKANAALEQAIVTVTADPRNTLAIDAVVSQVAFEVDHLKHVGQEVKRFRNVDDGEFEPLILALENRLHAIAQVLEQQDLRNVSLYQQAQAIKEKAQMIAASLNAKPDTDPRMTALVERINTLQADEATSEQSEASLPVEADTQAAQSDGVMEEMNTVIDTLQVRAGEHGAACR